MKFKADTKLSQCLEIHTQVEKLIVITSLLFFINQDSGLLGGNKRFKDWEAVSGASGALAMLGLEPQYQ